MSEKRFEKSKSDITDYRIYDYEKEDAYFIDCDDESTVDAIVNLLNKLYEDNEQLREILKDIVVATDETYTKTTSMFKVTVALDYEKYREIRRCIDRRYLFRLY